MMSGVKQGCLRYKSMRKAVLNRDKTSSQLLSEGNVLTDEGSQMSAPCTAPSTKIAMKVDQKRYTLRRLDMWCTANFLTTFRIISESFPEYGRRRHVGAWPRPWRWPPIGWPSRWQLDMGLGLKDRRHRTWRRPESNFGQMI